MISSSILRFSFFTLSSSRRDSIEDAGGGGVSEDFPAVFAASRLDFFGRAPGSLPSASMDAISADKFSMS